MQSIDRLVAIIKPGQPFLDWLRSLPDWDLEMTLEELRSEGNHNSNTELEILGSSIILLVRLS